MRIASKIILAVLLCTLAGFANEDLRFADSCYAARAEQAKGDKADAHNAKLMIDAYQKAMGDASVAEAATEGYVKSLYFSFRFVPFPKLSLAILLSFRICPFFRPFSSSERTNKTPSLKES